VSSLRYTGRLLQRLERDAEGRRGVRVNKPNLREAEATAVEGGGDDEDDIMQKCWDGAEIGRLGTADRSR